MSFAAEALLFCLPKRKWQVSWDKFVFRHQTIWQGPCEESLVYWVILPCWKCTSLLEGPWGHFSPREQAVLKSQRVCEKAVALPWSQGLAGSPVELLKSPPLPCWHGKWLSSKDGDCIGSLVNKGHSGICSWKRRNHGYLQLTTATSQTQPICRQIFHCWESYDSLWLQHYITELNPVQGQSTPGLM